MAKIRKMGINFMLIWEYILEAATIGIGAWIHKNQPMENLSNFFLQYPKGRFSKNDIADMKIIACKCSILAIYFKMGDL